jgi:hypothetical protein
MAHCHMGKDPRQGGYHQSIASWLGGWLGFRERGMNTLPKDQRERAMRYIRRTVQRCRRSSHRHQPGLVIVMS